MAEIRNVTLSAIDANPYRDLPTFPWIERKIEQLQRSFRDVGVWEGVIARPKGKRYETAFGHHRVEAARRNDIKSIPLIIRDLSDQQMLQFMGRENGEDYNADFLVMLNTWEAAAAFLAADRPQKPKPIDIARLLGWTAASGPDRERDQMNHTAKACYSVAALVAGGHETRSRYAGMSVYDVENVANAAYNRIQQAEQLGRQNKASATEVAAVTRQIVRGAAKTIDDLRAGKVARRDLRAHVDVNTYRFARESGRRSPLFAAFGKTVIEQIERMLNTDTVSDRLTEIREALPNISENEDKQVVQRIDLALELLGDRADDWRKKLRPGKNVVPLSTVPAKGA